ncbi:MAG TPA: hypothetical protein VMJ30_00660 [Gemmatimonadales bacterium]|nr:hypothetical protein [Gemmatimonadales bacterium]
MTEPAGPAPGVIPRLLHLVFCSGFMIFLAVAWFISRQMTPTPLPDLVIYLPVVVGAVMFTGALMLRTRLLDRDAPNSADWWRANLQRVILLWALFEGPGLFGAVIFLVSGVWIPLIASIIGLLLLVFHSPDQLRPE